jgi:Aspartyl/Asparaginyl beta-hydroxylase
MTSSLINTKVSFKDKPIQPGEKFMLVLYGIDGKKYLAILLVCQFGFFLAGFLFVLSLALKFDGFFDLPFSVISLSLYFSYGISALWIGLFWHAFSQIIFSVSSSTKIAFQKWFIYPTLVLYLLGTCTTHVMLLNKQFNNNFIIVFSPLLLSIFLVIILTLYITSVVFGTIARDKELNIQSHQKLTELKKDFVPEAFKRIELSIDLAYNKAFANPLPPQQGFTVVGLTSKPWYEIEDIPSAKLLEENHAVFRQETLKIIGDRTLFKPYDYPGINDGAWDSLELIEEGKFVENNCLNFPQTVKILEKLSKSIKLTSAAISVLKPGKIIKPHRDPASSSIICQLGLITPKNCGIRVGGEARTWQEGKCLFFDPSYEHTVWNYGDISRAVLLLVFWKPELTELEMEFLHLLEYSK